MTDVDQPDADDGSIDTESQMFIASEAREYALGNLSHQIDHDHIRAHAGIVQDEETEQVLNIAEDAYEPLTSEMPQSFYRTEFARKILRNQGTEMVRKALASGNFAYLDYMTGLTNYDPDVSGIQTLMWLEEWISRVASMNIIAGHMGTGKTDLSLLLAQVWTHYWTVVDGMAEDDVRVLTNITSCQQAETVTGQTELVEELEQSGKKLIIIDEASSNFSAHGGEGQEVIQQFKRTTRMIRKQDGYLVLIAHREDAKDVHKDIRLLCDILYKTTKKTAEVYEGRVDGEPKKTLTGIPQTDWDYDTLEESDWEWDLDDGDDGEDTPDWDEFYNRCLYEKDDGERCGTQHGLNQYGFCVHHEDSEQADRVKESEEQLVEYMRSIATDDEGEESAA